MNRYHASVPLAATLLLACSPEHHVTTHDPVEPPVTTPQSIPDAPLHGTIRGVPFVLRDARYIADHRPGYTHTDILLSAGKADASCEERKPANATSIWLRLEGKDEVPSQDFDLRPGKESPWSVHYQVRTEEGWMGNAEGAAVVSLHTAGPDGKISGGLSVCFADGKKSCVSGSFDAEPCPSRIDAPVRGAQPPEAIPEKYRQKLKAVQPPIPVLAPSASASAPPPAKP